MNPYYCAMQKRRDKLVIMSEILQIARTGALKTQIMYRANLSFAQLNEYLNFLTTVKLLRKFSAKEKETYVATEKGMDFLKKQQEIMGLLTEDEEFGINHRVPPESFFVRIRKEAY
jgi:predicted transcriptional regulator